MRNMASRRKFDLEFKERVLQYAEQHSGEKTAKHFNIDSKRIRYWRKQKDELQLADKSRARLTGGGRKKVSLELEKRLSEWIYSLRDKPNRVSRNMIKKKALEIYPSVSDGGKMFVASTGWLDRFLERNDLSLQHRTTMTQKDPNLLTEKQVCFREGQPCAAGPETRTQVRLRSQENRHQAAHDEEKDDEEELFNNKLDDNDDKEGEDQDNDNGEGEDSDWF